MADETAIVIFKMVKKAVTVDLEIPLSISANDLVEALNAAFDLNIDLSNTRNSFLKSENPIALLKGKKTLAEFGIRNGSVIIFAE